MARADAYVRRFKSLSLTVFAATLLTYNVFDSGQLLVADFEHVERLFFAVSLLDAEVPDGGEIEVVSGQAASEWLQNTDSKPPLPRFGPLVSLVKAWDAHDLQIDGSFQLSNGESIDFSRLPLLHGADVIETDRDAGDDENNICAMDAHAVCQRYILAATRNPDGHSIDIVYLPNNGARTTLTGSAWRYLESNFESSATSDDIHSKIVTMASAWIDTPDNSEDAYFSIREKLTQRTVRIPVIGLDVAASQAAAYLSAFAFVVAVLFAHSMITIANVPALSVEEPWIIVSSRSETTNWTVHLQNLISLIGSFVLTIIILCPVFIIGLSTRMAGDGSSTALFYLALVATIILTLASVIKFWSVTLELHKR